MAAYRRVYDSRHLQADCQELGSPPEPYARKSSMGNYYLFTTHGSNVSTWYHLWQTILVVSHYALSVVRPVHVLTGGGRVRVVMDKMAETGPHRQSTVN